MKKTTQKSTNGSAQAMTIPNDISSDTIHTIPPTKSSEVLT